MRYMILAVICCGCLGSKGLVTSQACIAAHAERQAANLQEIARLSAEAPLSTRQAELLRETAESAVRISTWTDLTQSHVGRAEAPPEIMTEAETGAQAVYRNEIELRKRLRSMLPFEIPGVGGGSGGLFNALAGGGPFMLLSTALGVFLKKKHGQEKRTRRRGEVAHAAALEAIELIGKSTDPELKKRAAEKAHLVEMYADQKLDEYRTRAMDLRRGGTSV